MSGPERRRVLAKIGEGFLYGFGFWTAAAVIITLWGVVLP